MPDSVSVLIEATDSDLVVTVRGKGEDRVWSFDSLGAMTGSDLADVLGALGVATEYRYRDEGQFENCGECGDLLEEGRIGLCGHCRENHGLTEEDEDA